MKRNLFAIALLLDLHAPSTQTVLKQNFDSFHRLEVLAYGSKNSETGMISSCKHVAEKIMPPSYLDKWPRSQTPTDGAPQPLAEAIHKVAFDLQYSLHDVTHIIVSTNAKDSCGEDPCKAFEHLNRVAKEKGRVVQIQNVGAPLGCPFEDMASLGVKNISDSEIQNTIGTDAKEIAALEKKKAEANSLAAKPGTGARGDKQRGTHQSSLADQQKALHGGELSASQSALSGGAGAPGGANGAAGGETSAAIENDGTGAPGLPNPEASTSPSPGPSGELEAAAAGAKSPAIGAMAQTSSVTVVDAPASAEFRAKTTAGDKQANWNGTEAKNLDAGQWKIQVAGYPAAIATVSIGRGEKRALHYYGDFHLPVGTVVFEGPPIGFDAIPKSGQTGAKSKTLNREKETLEAGQWELNSSTPSWLKGKLHFDVMVEPGSSQTLNVKDAMEEQVEWVNSSDTQDQLLVIEAGGGTKHALLPAGSPPIPVPKSAHWKLIPVGAL